MKIAVCSDLHLEFGGIELNNIENADVLVLSGDILCAEDLNRRYGDIGPYARVESHRYIAATVYRDFLDHISLKFPTVIYVAGNHEFYGCKWNKTLDILKEVLDDYSNIFFLENDIREVGDVTFVGCTMWTDMNGRDPMTLNMIESYMSDFRRITHDQGSYYSKLKPMDTVTRHDKSRKFIEKTVTSDPTKKYVVCTHHSPSFRSIPPEFADQHHGNGAYATVLDEFILDNPQIKMWTHGHTHDVFDYMIGETRIVCNPRGYKGYEQRAKDFTLNYFEV